MKTTFSPWLVALALLSSLGFTRANVITVTSTADSGAGTLRDALATAAPGDTIDATGVSGTIVLTNGELLVTKSVTIIGPGQNSLAVDGNASSRVFYLARNTIVGISSITIANGLLTKSSPSFSGGGIYNDHATLTLSNCAVNGNRAPGAAGIYNDGQFGNAALTIVKCTISGNAAFDGEGGGIANIAGFRGSVMLVIDKSSIIGNSTTAQGGGIYSDGFEGNAAVTIANSTISGNSATFPFFGADFGGAIYNRGSDVGNAQLTMVNCTLSGNSAGFGGAIYNDGRFGWRATLKLANCTISGNSANSGGGIFNDGLSGGRAMLEIGSTILNAGASGGNISNSYGTVTSDGYNLSSDPAGGDGTTGSGGLLNAAGDVRNTDPKLGPLQDDGGPNFTHPLLFGSPAIDQGKNFSGSSADQRGLSRTLDLPALSNAMGGDGTDIGAYEIQSYKPEAVCKDVTVPAGTNCMANVSIDGGSYTPNDYGTITLIQTPPGPYPLGTNIVTLTVTDNHGASSSCTATVTVLGNTPPLITAADGSPVSTGSGPYSVAVGDFNGDGKSDLAVANSGGDNVTILLGDGHGGFSQDTGSPVGTGSGAYSLAIGDFNSDGKLDLAVTDYYFDEVTILLGNGTGGFTEAGSSPVHVGSGPYPVVVADFNGDGKPDLAVANDNDSTVTILLGDGNSGFSQATGSLVRTGSYPEYLTSGDFNDDGKLDLAVVNGGDNTLTILLGDGTGSFTQAASSPVRVGSGPVFVAAGDFNGDGKPDLAVVNNGDNSVAILIGDGRGGFTDASGSPVGTGSNPQSVAVGDFNGDGKPDLAVVNSDENIVTIHLGNGSGVFNSPCSLPIGTGSNPQFVAVGNFNGSGKPDLVVANYGSDNLTILLNTPNANHPPVVICTNITVSAGTNCNAFASVDAGSFDPDIGDSITITQTPPGPYPIGPNNVTLTVTDSHSASNSCSATVTVVDTTPPIITGCPGNITVYTSPGRTTCDQVATWTPPTTSDSCSPVSLASNHQPGDTFPVGNTTVTYTARDEASNTTTCSFTVTVLNNTPPIITGCPSNVTVYTGPGRTTCDQVATWTPPTASDSCSSVSLTSNHQPGDTFSVGNTTVTYTATDGASNTTTCSFTVTVVDNTPPTINCPGNIVVANGGNCDPVANAFSLPGASDNCPGVTLVCQRSDGQALTKAFPVGITTVNCIATDASGNTATCGYTITVTSDDAIASDFNGTPIPGNSTIWFSSVIKPSLHGACPATVKLFHQTIQSSQFNVTVPDAEIHFVAGACPATTVHTNGLWITTVGCDFTGNIFLSGLAYQVPAAGLPGGIKPVTWSGTLVTDKPGVSVNWIWAAALYTTFATDNNAIGVKPVDGSQCTSYNNSDHAGTPENYKSYVIGGTRGGGGANWTGSLSGTLGVSPCATLPPQLSIRLVNGNVELVWPQGVLQATDERGGTYVDVPGATSPYKVAPEAAMKCYRIRIQ